MYEPSNKNILLLFEQHERGLTSSVF